MFYFFSKSLAFLIRPDVWILLLLLLATWKYGLRGKKYLWAALTCFLLFSNNGLLQLTLKWWEPLPIELEKHYDKAVVLGGYISENPLATNAYPEFGERPERLTHALALYQEDKVSKLIFTGGSGGVMHEQKAEAVVVGEFLEKLGYSMDNFILEPEALNTHENATKCVQETVVLVTSAWHMTRAAACFRKQGINIVPYPVDYMQSLTPLYPADFLLPKPAVLWHWEILIKEWVGYFVYWLKGYV